ncbi:MAG: DUF6567 family protein [bacterium]
MKKTILSLIAVVAMAFSMTSCITSGNITAMSDGTAISAANFTYVNTVTAQAETSYYLYLFGGSNIEKQVMDELRKKADLKPGQCLTNIRITTEEQMVVFGIIINKTVYGTADIVQFK